MTIPIITIVGRTNVGKSTLLNRLAGKRQAVVVDSERITRDRVIAPVLWQGREFILVDTGGWQTKPESTLESKVQLQVELGITQADAIIFVVDAQTGVIPSDEEVAEVLRSSNKPIVLAVNKVDSTKQLDQTGEFSRLGFGIPVAISAYHNLGIEDLMESVTAFLPTTTSSPTQLADIKLSIVGRPNVGKSTLLNTLLGTERAIVHDAPGTTRDAIDVVINWNNKRILLIDTAGIKRHSKISSGIEFYSLIRTVQAINRGDIAMLLIDATEFITVNDMHIANYITEAGKSMVLIVNKWDLIPQDQRQQFKLYMDKRISYMSYVPILYISAKLKLRTSKILATAYQVWEGRQKLQSDSDVDMVVKKAFEKYPPQRVGTKHLYIFKAHQDRTNPPTFVLEVNNPDFAYTSYQRYLKKCIRSAFSFPGSPLNLIFIRVRKKNKQKLKAVRT